VAALVDVAAERVDRGALDHVGIGCGVHGEPGLSAR
jgi:hypothetical protein